MRAGKRQRGHLLIEFAVAAAVATAAVGATIATVLSTSKSGREIEVLTQGVSDATAFAAYESNLHQMGGWNGGSLALEYQSWLNTNYPVQTLPNAAATTFNQANTEVASSSGTITAVGLLSVGFLGNAYNGAPPTPAGNGPLAGTGPAINPNPATFIWGLAGTNNMNLILTYAHAQAVVGLGAANTPTLALVAPSATAEAVQIQLMEDPGTGIVTVSPAYQVGTADLSTYAGGFSFGQIPFTPTTFTTPIGANGGAQSSVLGANITNGGTGF
jgi:hypothetical protein